MKTGDYMYAGTRSKTLERMLLSENQMELLVSAKSTDEVEKALYDTYLASYLSSTDGNIGTAVNNSIREAKQTLMTIAPDKRILDVLWLKYDFHNLKAIMKGREVGMSDEEILSKCYTTGTIEPIKLLRAYEENRLYVYNNHLEHARSEANEAVEILRIDKAMSEEYFAAIRDIAKETNDTFINKFTVLLIDLFNIKASLRAKHLEGIEVSDVYVSGGSFHREDFESEERILSLLTRFGGEKRWAPAIEHLEKTERYNRLEKLVDDYVTEWLKEESLGVFTPASLFSFFHARKNNAQIIHAITVAKTTGMPEKELRTILRRLHA